MNIIEAYEDKEGIVKFFFTHSDENFTTGIMIIKPNSELLKHNRPLAVENLIQIHGKCLIKLFSDENNFEEKLMFSGQSIQIPQAQFHIHANPYDEESVTLFLAQGDITKVMNVIRNDYNKINL